MKRFALTIAALAGLAPVISAGTARAIAPETSQAEEQTNQAELAAALKEPTVALADGLAAAEKEGKPISAKFEVEDGKLQLSVYTAKGAQFFEVVEDPKNGTVTKTEPITEGEDLVHAKVQDDAMTKGKTSLRTATDDALKTSSGLRAVSATPTLEDGRPVAAIILLGPEGFKTVTEKLD